MASNTGGIPRKNIQAYVSQNIPGDFIRVWQKLRDDNDKLTNLRTRWSRLYAEHCANVYDEEQRVGQIDQAQDTHKHVQGFWATLGIKHKATRSKIRTIGKWFKELPQRERETMIAQIPATKDSLYVAASYGGADLGNILKSNPISPESTTAQFRELLDKATPQDRFRNTRRTAVVAVVRPPMPTPAKARAPYRVTVTCRTWEAMTALIAYAKSHSYSYSLESAPPVRKL